MDFGQIDAFVQVSTHRSFSRAADMLQLTQPSITARIQTLERELGEELFERSGRGVRMTDAGLAFLPYADRMLQTLREGRDAVDEVGVTRGEEADDPRLVLGHGHPAQRHARVLAGLLLR